MIIQTNKGETIQASDRSPAPWFSDFHKAWYVWGFRFIKSKGRYSKSEILHNFASFTPVQG